MSTFSYARAQATARRLIDKFGNAAVLTRTAFPAGTQTTINTKLAVDKQVTHILGNSQIAIGDKICVFDDRHEPKEGDRVTWGSDSGVVVGPVVPLRVNGVDTAFFTAPVRGG